MVAVVKWLYCGDLRSVSRSYPFQKQRQYRELERTCRIILENWPEIEVT
jgi:hypothetical protein